MWDKVGIIREKDGLETAFGDLHRLGRELESVGVPAGDRAFNLTWHDWLNLKNQILVSEFITVGAMMREESRGAHFRSDFPETGDLETSSFTSASLRPDGHTTHLMKPVEFTIVQPGDSLIEGEAGAPPAAG